MYWYTALAITGFIISNAVWVGVVAHLHKDHRHDVASRIRGLMECQKEADKWEARFVREHIERRKMQPWYDLLVKPYIDAARNWSA